MPMLLRAMGMADCDSLTMPPVCRSRSLPHVMPQPHPTSQQSSRTGLGQATSAPRRNLVELTSDTWHTQLCASLPTRYIRETLGRDDPPASVPGRVAKYAQGSADYHDVLKGMLRELAEFLHEHRPGCRTRGVVDTAPLVERDFARLAGLGWFGKNTMLINKRAGSWLFLAALLTDVELSPDEPHNTSHCGTCTRCLDVCPTDAFPEPYVLDARRCISYLNIELRGPMPAELREGVGDWLFGCDLCQDVCPWNNKAPTTDRPEFQPSDDLSPADAVEILQMDEAAFRERFRHTPLSRPKRAGLLRNAAIVLGNSGRAEAVQPLIRTLQDREPLVRGAVAWALGNLGGEAARTALRNRLAVEKDNTVRGELIAALTD